MEDNYKTINENNAIINPNTTPINESYFMTLHQVLFNLQMGVTMLDRYDGSYDQGVIEDKEGDYVKLEDVLNLFFAKKYSIKKE